VKSVPRKGAGVQSQFSARYDWIHLIYGEGLSFDWGFPCVCSTLYALACATVCGPKKKNFNPLLRHQQSTTHQPPRSGAQEKRWTRGESNPGPLPGLDSKHCCTCEMLREYYTTKPRARESSCYSFDEERGQIQLLDTCNTVRLPSRHTTTP
jgi:hypothetical protein